MAVHNADIARCFDEIADLLELRDENPFRIRAYRNAARVIGELRLDVAETPSPRCSRCRAWARSACGRCTAGASTRSSRSSARRGRGACAASPASARRPKPGCARRRPRSSRSRGASSSR